MKLINNLPWLSLFSQWGVLKVKGSKLLAISLKRSKYSRKKFTGQFESNNSAKLKSEKGFWNKCFMVKQTSIQI